MALGKTKFALILGFVFVSTIILVSVVQIYSASRKEHPAISKSEGDAAIAFGFLSIIPLLISTVILLVHTYQTEI